MADAVPQFPEDRWILAQRGLKNRVDPRRPYYFLHERERTSGGNLADVHVLFLTNRECPFRCLMCDLWKNTMDTSVQPGDIPAQIRWALERLPPAHQIKLYNSGNFFDRKAIPRGDFPVVAGLLERYKRVVVESHPKLLGEDMLRFRDMLSGDLEVAMGLETVEPNVLMRLNKRMTTDDFQSAARFLSAEGVYSRAFILLRPPFMSEQEGVHWAKRSVEFAFEAGVDCCVVIPTRAGNGALERLEETGSFQPPLLESLEEVVEWGIRLGGGRVFADLWDTERLGACDLCLEERKDRLHQMNLQQSVPEPVRCDCG